MFILPSGVMHILDRLTFCGYEAFVVGGCVRDLVMGIDPHDYDVTTSATPEEVKKVFADLTVIETGIQHGTVTVIYEKQPYEITTYRLETSYTDGRHPDSVIFTSHIEEDLARRDFTVNAMAYHPSMGIVDPFGGREDIQKKCLRCVGDPYRRFGEDALRILRLLRFSSVLSFSIEEQTSQAARALKDKLTLISAERLASELIKLLCGANVSDVMVSYIDVLSSFIPEVFPMKDFDQMNYHHCFDVLTHTAKTVEAVKADKVLRLAAFFHDIGKPSTFSLDENGVGHFFSHQQVSAELTDIILKRLKLDTATRETVVRLVKWHDLQIEPEEKAVKKALGKMTPEFFFRLLDLKRADTLAQHPDYHGRLALYDKLERIAHSLLSAKACFTLKDLSVNGNDLLAIGYPKGREIGLMLSLLLDRVIANELTNDKQILLQYAKDHKDRIVTKKGI